MKKLKPVKLLHCKCGGKAKTVSAYDETTDVFIDCKSCWEETARYPTKEQAIKSWNKRMKK